MVNPSATKCEVEYCLYNTKKYCTLINPPMINAHGMCDECTTITLDDAYLKSEKERQLQELESRWDPTMTLR